MCGFLQFVSTFNLVSCDGSGFSFFTKVTFLCYGFRADKTFDSMSKVKMMFKSYIRFRFVHMVRLQLLF